MPIDLSKFTGRLPYAAELFGIYQPLIGWRSRQGLLRTQLEQGALTRDLIEAMGRDPRFRRAIGADKQPKGPDSPLPPEVPGWLNQVVSAQWQTNLGAFRTRHGRDPIDREWKEFVAGLDLDRLIQPLTQSLSQTGRDLEHGGISVLHVDAVPAAELAQIGAVRLGSTPLALVRKPKSNKKVGAGPMSMATEAALQAGTMKYLAAEVPGALSAVTVSVSIWQLLLNWLDPLAQFDPETQDAVLSPIGMVHVYRQYFFELDSFLGPAVGHVWVAPGTTLELFETHSRKRIEQRSFESRTQSMTRSEKEIGLEDEVANRFARDTSSDVSVGVTASAGVNFGVWQANASASFGYKSAQKSAHETAHKRTRKQTEKITDELRRDVKTTFRTSVETSDTSSRRYVVSNGTEQLINYEFRRKMRQVAVQVQHVGVQLCWQSYVDAPGAYLSIPEIVHIASRGDLAGALQPPEAPPTPAPIEQEYEAIFPYTGTEDEMDETYFQGKEEAPDFLFFDFDRDGIDCVKGFDVVAPQSGYELKNVQLRDVQGTDPEQDTPSPLDVTVEPVNGHRFRIRLTRVNFRDNPALRMFLTLTFGPTKATIDQQQQEFAKKVKDYEGAKLRAAHQEYVREVRERIKLASRIEKRESDDLRAEERTAIFDRLLRQLRPGAGDESTHVTVELIRAIFDVEKMLYFVAESWWTPRARLAPTYYASKGEALGPGDQVGWGGPKAAQKKGHAPPYLITEESAPQPVGASLGWLLQLDGDEHRNAFLNSPFVKAVIPIRPGKEAAAMAWLERAHVEGADGLDTPYRGVEPEYTGMTVRDVLRKLAAKVHAEESEIGNTLATETVYQNGFDPLAGGFAAGAEAYQVFDQWIEVVPTEQVVAVPYQVPTP